MDNLAILYLPLPHINTHPHTSTYTSNTTSDCLAFLIAPALEVPAFRTIKSTSLTYLIGISDYLIIEETKSFNLFLDEFNRFKYRIEYRDN